ncbi:MAG: metal-dependent transcriptional regulator [Erysipelotrichales bacterium]|nr:metal-dependent transcriptional regulator [Erysipelotrichales bacterium]
MKKIQKSGEDYLETIYLLSLANINVRSVDVANSLGVTKPSVAKALKILEEQEYIKKGKYAKIALTEKGKLLAELIQKKHKAIRMLLIEILKVSPEKAEIDACRIEHCLSEETTEKLFDFLNIK